MFVNLFGTTALGSLLLSERRLHWGTYATLHLKCHTHFELKKIQVLLKQLSET